jgi:hypothetical protein
MTRRHGLPLALLAVALAFPARAAAQPARSGAQPDSATAQAASPPRWEVAAAAYTYLLPDEGDFVQPTVQADRGPLHLEARLNYEDLDTGSLWIGYNAALGEAVTLELTPMLGVVLGATDGVAPGYKATLAWRALALYSETEYVIDAEARENDFLYTWSELTVAPREWWRVGLVVQRTKAYETAFDIQRGALVGITYKAADVSAYVFHPDEGRPTVVLAVAVEFPR